MVYSFARVSAEIGMNVEDVYSQNRRLWVRLHEKGGKQHAMPPPRRAPLDPRLPALHRLSVGEIRLTPQL